MSYTNLLSPPTLSYGAILQILIDNNYCIVYNKHKTFIIYEGNLLDYVNNSDIIEKLEGTTFSYSLFKRVYNKYKNSKNETLKIKALYNNSLANHIVFILAIRHLYAKLNLKTKQIINP